MTGPGKIVISAKVRNSATATPPFKPSKKKAMAIGISQNRKYQPGKNTEGIPTGFNATASAVKMMINAIVLVFTVAPM